MEALSCCRGCEVEASESIEEPAADPTGEEGGTATKGAKVEFDVPSESSDTALRLPPGYGAMEVLNHRGRTPRPRAKTEYSDVGSSTGVVSASVNKRIPGRLASLETVDTQATTGTKSVVAAFLDKMSHSQKLRHRFRLDLSQLPRLFSLKPRKQEFLRTGVHKQEQELKQHLNDLGIRDQQLEGGAVELCLPRFFATSAEGVSRSTWKDEAGDLPDGWTRIAVTSTATNASTDSWERAYHGTTTRSVSNIIDLGLKKPGTRLSGSAGTKVMWIKTRNGVAGAGGDGAVYCSPSLWCASHPSYAPLEFVGEGLWLQIVCEVRVKPGTYTRQSNTLAIDDWDPHVLLDPNRNDNRGIEWVVNDDQDIEVVGVLVRQLGAKASASRFGKLVRELKPPPSVPVVAAWRDILENTLKKGGYVEDDVGSVTVAENAATWRLPAAMVQKLRQRERFLSAKFSVCGIDDLVLIFWPRGDVSAKEGMPESCSLYILGMPPGFFNIGLTIGSEHREFAHEFDYTQTVKNGVPVDRCFGYASFCRTAKVMKDMGPDGLEIKATLIAKDSMYLGPGIGRTVMSNGGQNCTWQISEQELRQLLPMQRAYTRPLELGGISGITLVFFPNETGNKVDLCSFYAVVPTRASIDWEVSIGSWKTQLKFEADGQRNTGWGWCRGYPNCCVLKDVHTSGKPLELKVKVFRKFGFRPFARAK